MKRVLLGLISIMVAVAVHAQFAQPTIVFDEKTHDFGTIQEADGKVSYVFKFTNKGDQPLVVHNVKASCGCTTPEWTKTPVLPGKSGTIKATFDPQNRPGNFNKTITVYSNSSTENEILRITGLVKEKTKSLEDEYPRSMDLIRLESTHLSLTKVAPDQKKTEDFRIISISDKPVTIDFDNVPAHLKIEAVPQTLQPNQEGIIRVTYDAALKNDWGFLVDNLYLKFNGEKDYQNRLTVSATIQEDFST